jgi:1-aminocyclopropane-1-carboxylate deaminase/D-cysteine desulfhydrase-like pyridoxal-dependent ACC family enzyme
VDIEGFGLLAPGVNRLQPEPEARSLKPKPDQYTERFMPGASASLATLPLIATPSAVHELSKLRRALGGGPRLLVKRDDAIPFAFGGNKVRKIAIVAAAAVAECADTLITCGGVQSNHARVTAITAATLGLRCILVANAPDGRPDRLTGNALLNQIVGADVRYVAARADRDPAMSAAAEEVIRQGGRPCVIPLGASTPAGAAAFVSAVEELVTQVDPPDVIVHSTSSGGTQAGLVAGCLLAGLATRVLGISADDPTPALEGGIRRLLAGLAPLMGVEAGRFDAARVEVDDGFVGGGYGVPTDASREALSLLARTEGIFLDPTYTAKAMAGLIARVRAGAFRDDETILFWHTGGQVGIFA